jgi:hypothetical protein
VQNISFFDTKKSKNAIFNANLSFIRETHKAKKTIFANRNTDSITIIRYTLWHMTEQEFISRADHAWKKQDWKECLDCYAEAIRINPHSIASAKREMVLKIIKFYNKDMLNP